MITEIQRTLSGIYSSANSTIIFDSNPYLFANSDVILYFTNNDSKFSASVTSVSGNNAVINFTNPQYANNRVTVKTNYYGAGVTGVQEPFSFKFSTIPNAIIQVGSDGGTSSLSVEGSLDAQHWVTLGSIPVTTANANTGFITVSNPWAYGRLNISSIGTGQQISVYKAT